MNIYRRFVTILVLIFIVFSIFFLTASSLLTKWNIDNKILLAGNVLLFIINLVIFFMQRKALLNSNPNFFVRSVMAGMMIKLFTIAIAVIVYALTSNSHFNTKITLMIFLVLYI